MLSILMAFALQGAAATGRPSVITMPDWEELPSAEEMAAHYPQAASAAGVGGLVVMECVVTREGVLAQCRIGREEPAGLGFGEAALEMSGSFRMRPMTRDGQPVSGGRIRIPIRFQAPTPSSAPPPSSPAPR